MKNQNENGVLDLEKKEEELNQTKTNPLKIGQKLVHLGCHK
jgi:hypothetical protein